MSVGIHFIAKPTTDHCPLPSTITITITIVSVGVGVDASHHNVHSVASSCSITSPSHCISISISISSLCYGIVDYIQFSINIIQSYCFRCYVPDGDWFILVLSCSFWSLRSNFIQDPRVLLCYVHTSIPSTSTSTGT